jgi:hypothetical protein
MHLGLGELSPEPLLGHLVIDGGLRIEASQGLGVRLVEGLDLGRYEFARSHGWKELAWGAIETSGLVVFNRVASFAHPSPIIALEVRLSRGRSSYRLPLSPATEEASASSKAPPSV